MIDVPRERDPVDVLADEFAERCRRGEAPSWADYAARYPEYAEQIEELFPAVALMEQLRVQQHAEHDAAVRRSAPLRLPEHIGDFHMLQEIGRGGMGIVYAAEQRSLARRVAVKVLPKHALLLERHLKRFQHEAQTAARLLHTNIVPVFGVGEQDGLHYYVMPLVRGVGLDELIGHLRLAGVASRPAFLAAVETLVARKFGPAPACETRPASGGASFWHAVARVGLQAAEALDYAHAQGTLHRDIKPGNLLIDAQGAVSVADFGLARAVEPEDAGRSAEVVGTPRYMAPEQRRGMADARSDVYALGATLYELLTLQSPAQDPQRPRRIDPAIPRDLETILVKCLAPQPWRRYANAAALAGDLRRFLADEPILARRASAAERAWRWCRRNPALAATSGLAAVSLLAVAVTVAAGYLHTRRAYAETRAALARAEATSRVSLDVLESIYLQLSPERAGIAADAAAVGGSCGCMRLHAGAGPAPLPPSKETARLLEDLLGFYDRLAEQAGKESRVRLEAAIASRRVGDIQQRLGRWGEADRQYQRAVEKLNALDDQPEIALEVAVELARTHNEIGNVRSARLDHRGAYQAHHEARRTLEAFRPADDWPEAYRYELMVTYAWVPVGLFPGQRRLPVAATAEESLRKALEQSQWLLARRPATAQYAGAQALILAKLGMLCWQGGRLAQAEQFFQRAVDMQAGAESAGLSAPNHILLASMRLRLGQVVCQRGKQARDAEVLNRSHAMLASCVAELEARPELAHDALARNLLLVARGALNTALAPSPKR